MENPVALPGVTAYGAHPEFGHPGTAGHVVRLGCVSGVVE